jgi:exodeoxyribonuclease VII small subunit
VNPVPAKKAKEQPKEQPKEQSKEQSKEQPELRYEEGIAQLEALVEGMEEGELSLEETLAAYERGVALHAQLEALLKRGEKRIEMLVCQNGDAERVPFESEPEHLAFTLEDE